MFHPHLIRADKREMIFQSPLSAWWLRGLLTLGLSAMAWGGWTWNRRWGWVWIALGSVMAFAACQLEFIDLTLDLKRRHYALRRQDVLGDRRTTGSFHQFECIEMLPVKHWTGQRFGAFLQWKRGTHRMVRATATAPRRGSTCLELHRSKRAARKATERLARRLGIPVGDRTKDPIDLP